MSVRLEVTALSEPGLEGAIHAALFVPAHFPDWGDAGIEPPPLGYTCADGESPLDAVHEVLDWHRELFPDCRCTSEIENRYAGM